MLSELFVTLSTKPDLEQPETAVLKSLLALRRHGVSADFQINPTHFAIILQIENTRQYALVCNTLAQLGTGTVELAKNAVLELLPEPTPPADEGFNPYLFMRIDHLDLTVAAKQDLKDQSLLYIGDLASKTERELLALDGVGHGRVEQIRRALRKVDPTLTIGMPIVNWPPAELEYDWS